jgi:GH24 family phage-related lysozyme (muramidase)
MDQEQNQGTPLTSLMRWDGDGELCSEDLERLLVRLQAQDVSQQTHDRTSASKKARGLSNQLATRSSTT